MKTDERFYCSQVLAISDETQCTSFLKLLLNWASGIKYSRVFFSHFVGEFLLSIQIVLLIFKLRNLMLYLKDCFWTKLMTNASF